MDLEQLEQWIETDEGKQWADALKSGLVNKRDELLKSIKDGNAALTELEQRAAAAEKSLSEERAALSAILVDQELSRLLKDARVFDNAIPSTIATLKENYVIQVKADGLNRTACGKVKGADGTETETDLAGIVTAWRKTPEAKQIALATSTGGGAPGSGAHAIVTTDLKNISGPALAKMSDAEFQNARSQMLDRAKEN